MTGGIDRDALKAALAVAEAKASDAETEPQTNGVAERFNRTLKEQIIHGRIYRNIAELRDAVRDFVELYNAPWIVEKNGYLSPAQAARATGAVGVGDCEPSQEGGKNDYVRG